MKIVKYASIVLSLFLFGCGGDDDDSARGMVVQNVEATDFHIYTGSAEGPVEYKYYNTVAADKVDSLRSALINKYVGTQYKENQYSGFIIEFNGPKITYTFKNNGSTRKIIADYQFDQDSLFAIQSSTSRLFVALGSQPDALYRTNGISRYPFEAKDTLVTSDKIVYDLDKVLDLYGKNLTDEKDTIVWLNTKYHYK